MRPFLRSDSISSRNLSRVADMRLRTSDSDVIRLSDFRGKTIVVNFWGTTCVHCLEELPAIDRLQKQFADQHLIVLSICADEDDPLFVAEVAERIAPGHVGLYRRFRPADAAAVGRSTSDIFRSSIVSAELSPVAPAQSTGRVARWSQQWKTFRIHCRATLTGPDRGLFIPNATEFIPVVLRISHDTSPARSSDHRGEFGGDQSPRGVVSGRKVR